MLKIPASILATIILFILPAAAQNSNTAVNRRPPRPVSDAGIASNYPVAAPPANSTIRGRVYYEDTGRPVKRTSVMFITVESGPGETGGLTDGDGNFVVKNVRAGTYYAVVNAPGVVSPIAYVDFAKMGPRGGGNSEKDSLGQAFINFDKIIVDGVNEVYVQIPAKHGGAISGRVLYENGDSAIGVKVEILRKVNGKYVSVVSSFMGIMNMFSGGGGQTDDRGMYRFSGLPPGEYIVKASENAQHTEPNNQERYNPMGMESLLFGMSSMLNFYYPDAADVKDAQVLNVLLGQEQNEINIIIPDTRLFGLSGKVISQKDKKPLAGAKISLQKKNQSDSSLFALIGGELNTVTTDVEGNWKFKELPKGDYTLTVTPNNRTDDDDVDESAYGGASNVPVKPKTQKPKFAKSFKDAEIDDKNVEDLIIELGYGAAVSGTVSVEGNKEMPQNVSIQALGEHEEILSTATVWNYKREAGANVAIPPQKPNKDFKLENISAGSVKLRFNVSDDAYYVKSAMSGMTDLLTSPLDIKESDVISGIKVTLANDVGTLRGRIIDENERPAGSVALLLVPMDQAKRNPSFFKNVRSDTFGSFEIRLPPGEYAILFLKPGITEGESAAFDAWLAEAMKSPEKASVSAEGTTNISLKKPAQ